MSAAWFTESDRYRMFTKQALAERLGEDCTPEWFAREHGIRGRCKGRLFSGSDILRALENPPTPEDDERHAAIADIHASTPPRRLRSNATCASIEPIGRTKHGA